VRGASGARLRALTFPHTVRVREPARGNTATLPVSVFGFFALFLLAAVGVNVFAIVDVARRSDRDFKAVGSEKTMWLVLALLMGLPAAIAYLVAVRPRLEAAPPLPLALPGWYPDPAFPSYLRYHDGFQWTAHTAPMLPAAPMYPALPPAQPHHGWNTQANPAGGEANRAGGDANHDGWPRGG